MIEFIRINTVGQILEALNEFESCFNHLREKIVNLEEYAEKLTKYANVLLLTDGDANVGIAVFYSNDIKTKTGYISLIGLKQEYRGYGFGKILISKIEEMMISDFMLKSKLEVDIDNARAIGFYKHLGYVEIVENLGGGNSFYMEKPLWFCA